MQENKEAVLSLRKSKAVVYRLLKYRVHSEKEVYTKLKRKSFSDQTIEETLKYFKELELIDDRQFTKEWISARLNKPFGFHRIQHELKLKGIDDGLLKAELHEALSDYSEVSIVQDLAQQRAVMYKGLDPMKAKQRIYGYLSQRGFSPEVVKEVVSLIEL